MHTLEALYDPKTGLQFNEPIQIDKPMRVLITIIDEWPLNLQKKSHSNLLQKLTRIHQMPCSTHRSETEIENYIQANRDNWD
ncbi:hypothetical protein BGP_6419 [Beggiatoa sp. PS]|nr:hypothetical protein BGP_6419 [Beggiatoa sp. PS]